MASRRRTTLAVAALLAAGLTGCDGGSSADPPVPSTTSTTTTTTHGPTTTKPTTTPSSTPTDQTAIVDKLPGPTSGSSCAKTDARNVRSGWVGAGDFDDARRVYKAGGTGADPATVSLHVIPGHPGSMSGVKLNMTRLRRPPFVYDFSFTKTETVNGTKYYVLTFPVNQPGLWRLTITAGADKGCFDVAFNRPT